MTRRYFIERTLRQLYGGFPNDDASISVNLVNAWMNDGIALAAKQNYKDNISIDGIGYVNNSFYTTFKGLTISADGDFTWKMQLPEIPIGIGRNEGISLIELQDSSGRVTSPFIPLTQNQRTYYKGMRPIPNKVLYYYENEFVYAISTLLLNQYTGKVTLVSGGDFNDLDSELNVPSDYFPVIVEYIKQQLMFERNVPVDVTNDGNDALKYE